MFYILLKGFFFFVFLDEVLVNSINFLYFANKVTTVTTKTKCSFEIKKLGSRVLIKKKKVLNMIEWLD